MAWGAVVLSRQRKNQRPILLLHLKLMGCRLVHGQFAHRGLRKQRRNDDLENIWGVDQDKGWMPGPIFFWGWLQIKPIWFWNVCMIYDYTLYVNFKYI